jgi:hypothetical protein
MSAQVAWGEVALSAGWGSSMARMLVNPPYEIPSTPTRPLLPGTFFTSQSMVS